MNTNGLAKHYVKLTAVERFALVLSAGARGDEAEQDRLVGAGERIVLSMADYAPFARAFEEVALLVFVELLDGAAAYLDAFHRSDDAEIGAKPARKRTAGKHAPGRARTREDDRLTKPVWQRLLDVALPYGFLLKTKAAGWELFCGRLNVPAFALWNALPGFDRVQRALKLAREAAFTREGMVAWLDSIRPKGTPEMTAPLVSAESSADELDALFRRRVEWWGG
jgi:hypothetical protein